MSREGEGWRTGKNKIKKKVNKQEKKRSSEIKAEEEKRAEEM